MFAGAMREGGRETRDEGTATFDFLSEPDDVSHFRPEISQGAPDYSGNEEMSNS